MLAKTHSQFPKNFSTDHFEIRPLAELKVGLGRESAIAAKELTDAFRRSILKSFGRLGVNVQRDGEAGMSQGARNGRQIHSEFQGVDCTENP